MLRIEISEFNHVKKYKRECLQEVNNFINSDKCYDGKILVLYGLQGTGKTTIMQQVLQEYENPDKCAFYEVENSDDLTDIKRAIIKEKENGVEVICLDEITRASDFIIDSAVLPDIFAKTGIKIIATGDDSLGFSFADENELYDRTVRVNTTYISFAEHCRVLETDDIDDYIQYGGLMKKGEDGKRIVFDYESAYKYLASAVVENISNSMKNSSEDSCLDSLSFSELRTIVEKMVEIYSSKLSVNNAESVIKIAATKEMIATLEKYLFNMNFLSVTLENSFSYTEETGWTESGTKHEYYIMQPAIKYYHLGKIVQQKPDEKIKEDMTEQIIIFDTGKILPSDNYLVSKPVFYIDGKRKGEYDMLVYDKQENKYWSFIITHKPEPLHLQEQHLQNAKFREIIDKKYGYRKHAGVLYPGKPFIATSGTIYLNITEFMLALNQYKDMDQAMFELTNILK